jgi:uncharacterized protein YegJ (DUF2314 family)
MNDIRLANTEERSEQSQGRFWLPALEDRQTLRPGDYAKIIFETAIISGERMWVEVVTKTPEGRYLGILDNIPVVVLAVKRGDMIEFGPENVCEILRRGQC